MRSRLPLAILLALLASLSAAFAADGPSFNQVKPGTFDPDHTFLVQAAWLSGIGCPTNAKLSPTGTFTDNGCLTGDPRDKQNQGLLLAKTGPTGNNAAAVADLRNVKGITLTELGYDIRKTGTTASGLGSHCGGGAPRFNVETTTGFWFIACNSPAPTTQTIPIQTRDGFTRLRWSPPIGFNTSTSTFTLVTGTVKSIQIVFDEGYDTGPDFFGLAVLDNIDVNGVLVGQGRPSHDDEHDRPKRKDKGD